MRLVEQGKLDLEATVCTYLPDVRVADETVSKQVRLRHLMTHTAGWYGDDFTETGDGDDALEKYVTEMADLPQLVPLGKHFSYNNAAFSLAGRVLEVVTGQPFEAAIGELVLQPLGLEETFFFPEEIMTKAFVVGHASPPDDLQSAPVVVEPWADIRAGNPAGGEISSVADQLRYARFHLGDGTAKGKPVLSPAGMRRMQTALGPGGAIGDVFLDGFGVAWQLWQAGGVPVVSHGGSMPGQQSSFVLVPDRDFAVTVLTNAESGVTLGMEVTDWALDAFLGLRRPPLTPLPVSPDRLADYTGNYAFGEDVTVRITERDDGLQLALAAPEENIPAIDVPLSFVGDDLVILEYLGMTILSDFVRNDTGEIGWVRFSGRMAPRAA
jgi:CubicO group peptidase (beta-lactamase class C family)